MYQKYDRNRLLEAVFYFGYTVDDLNNYLNDTSDNKLHFAPQLDDDGWPLIDSEDINAVIDIDTGGEVSVPTNTDTDADADTNTDGVKQEQPADTDIDTDITIDVPVNTDALTDSDLELKLVLDLSPQDFQGYLNRMRACGVELNPFIIDFCLRYNVFELDNAIQVLEQQIENKESNRYHAELIGQDVDNPVHPDYRRYHLENPKEFFINALKKGLRPNKKSERYSKLRLINEFKPQLTIKRIKEMYPQHKWLEAAEHFGYSADDLVE